MSELKMSHEDGLAVVEICREERRNALNGPLWDALADAARSLRENPPRAVIVTGRGGHFCAGMDLSFGNPLIERLAPAVMNKDMDALRELIRGLKEILFAFGEIPCPVIAAVEGACAGGGLELALACDLRVASRDAFFSLPETHVGMLPDLGGTVRVTHLLGQARATEFILSGRRMKAEEAYALGLVNRLTDPGNALGATRELIAELSKSGPEATREVLTVLRSTGRDPAAYDRETEAGARALATAECLEGVQAFMEKRPPRWAQPE